jgi:arsenite methyltransferase
VVLTARRVGPTGYVYGLDMTDEMLQLARRNAGEAGYTNVEFIRGEIEAIPLPPESVDVIISNCVVNLSPEKERVIAEAYRVLRPGGRLAISDMVFQCPPSPEVRRQVALWGACVSGGLTIDDYQAKLENEGFVNVEIEITREYGEALREAYPELCETGDISGLSAAFVRAVKPRS